MKSLPLMVAAALFAVPAFAQQNYVITSTTMTYQPVVGGTNIVPLMTQGGSWGAKDEGYYLLPLGFSFPYFGNTYTDVGINSNGVLVFGTTNQAACNYTTGTILCTSMGTTPSTSRTPHNFIAPWNGDHEGSATGEIRWVKPNASSIVIEFHNWENYSDGGPDQFSFQVKLDSSGIFQVHYGPKAGSFYGLPAFENDTGTQGGYLMTCGTSCTEANWTPNQLITVGEPNEADLMVPEVGLANIQKSGSNLTFTVSPKFMNFGKTDALNFHWKAYLSTDKIKDAADQLVYDSSVSGTAISVLQKSSLIVNANAAATNVAAGNYYVLVEADSTSAVLEFSETNNVGNTANYFTFGIDLVATSASGPSQTGPGNPATVTVSWFNQGTDPAPTAGNVVQYRILLSTDKTFDGNDFVAHTGTEVVTGGATFNSVPVNFTIPTNVPGGDYYWGIQVDSNAQVTEASETNNVAFASALTKVFQADLEAISVDLLDPLTKVPTRTGYLSGTGRFQVKLTNVGGANANNFKIGVVLSKDSNLSLLNDHVIHDEDVAQVLAGANATLEFDFTFPANDRNGQPYASGNYYMFVILDSYSSVTELNESNNTRPVGDPTIAPVNLRAPAADYTILKLTAPGAGAVGELLPLSRIIKNIGNEAGQTVTYRFYASANDIIDVQDTPLMILGSNGQVIDSGTVTLAAGESHNATEVVRIPATLQPGTWYLGAIVDVAKVQTELDETNNGVASSTPTQLVASSLVITTGQLPDATMGMPYGFKLSVVGADGPVTWSSPDGLPTDLGLTLSDSGIVSGTAQKAAVAAFTVVATTPNKSTVARLVIRVQEPSGMLAVTSLNLPPVINSAQKGYEANLAAAGGAKPYTWTLLSGSLPNGIQMSADGVFSGAVRSGVANGERPILVEVKDALGTRATASLKIKVVEPGALMIASYSVPDTMVNSQYDIDLSARNADGTPVAAPLTWSVVSGRLPEGLTVTTIGEQVGLITGKPVESGSFPFSMQVVDAKGRADVADFVLRVHASRLRLLAANIPATLHPGDEVSFQITTGSSESRYRLFSGALPPGVSINENGTVSGIVEMENSVGTWNFVVEAQTAAAGSNLGAFSVEVTPVPVQTGCSASGSSSGGMGWLALFAPLFAFFMRQRRSAALASVAALAVAVPQIANAQAQTYTIQGPAAAAYQSLAGGTTLPVSTSVGAQATIPFDFEFYGVKETSVGVSPRGYLAFGGDLNRSTNYGIPNTVTSNPQRMIAAWWDTLATTTTSPATVVKYGTIGASPNRVMVIEWGNVCATTTCSATNRFSFQVQLYEGSNKIRIHYGPVSGTSAPSTSASVGIMGSSTVGLPWSLCTTATSGGCSSAHYQAGQYLEFAQPPDLQIKSTSAEDVGYAGVQFQASSILLNKGGLPVPSNPGAKVRYYLSQDTTLDPAVDAVLGETTPTAAVDVNQEVTVTGILTVPSSVTPGSYFLYARVDPDNAVAEGDKESNNTSAPMPFTVGAPTPDLTVITVAGPNGATAAQALSIQRSIKNLGNADATASFNATYFVSDNSVVTISDTPAGQVTVGGIVAGATNTATDTVTLPAGLPAGRYWIGLCVDYAPGGAQGGAIQEISEVNNCATGNPFVLNTGALAVLTTQLTQATQNSPYGLRLEATGGDGTYVWSLDSGSLPPGMSLSSAGDLVGTPSAAGTFTFAVKVVSAGEPKVQSLSLTVVAKDLPLAIVDQDLPTAEFGRGYLHALVATGGTPPYTWTLKSGSRLPEGLGLSTDGYVEGRPAETTVGSDPFMFSVEIKDAAGTMAAKNLGIRVVQPSSMHIATSRLQTGYLGKTYRQKLESIGGTGAYDWSVVKFQKLAQDPTEIPGEPLSTLPDNFGLVVTPVGQGAELTGTPTQAGLYAITLRAQDRINTSVEDITTLPLLISYEKALAITTTALPDAFIGQPYNARISTNAESGVQVAFTTACVQQATSTGTSFTYSCVTGDQLQAVPAGLILAGDGSISGTATTPQLVTIPGQPAPEPGAPVTYSFLVKVTDGSGRADVRSLSIKVRENVEYKTGCSGSGLGPVAMALFALGGLWIRRRRA